MGLHESLCSFKKCLKTLFYDRAGIKTNIIQAGFIFIYSLLLCPFFLLILKETKIKIFSWAPDVVPKE